MAMSIEKVFGPDMGHLLRMQFEYDRTNDDDPA
jgi:plasmid maintenance system antidote protein VapI